MARRALVALAVVAGGRDGQGMLPLGAGRATSNGAGFSLAAGVTRRRSHMGDREIRKLLEDIITDIDAGRLRVPGIRGRVLRYLGPPLLAASLGMTGCGDTALHVSSDASVDSDIRPPLDAAYMAPDTGPFPAYMGPMDGTVDDGAVDDGAVDDGAVDDGAVDDDADVTPTDAAVDEYEDAGAVPPYMGPPPPDPY